MSGPPRKRHAFLVLVIAALMLSGCDWSTVRFGSDHTGWNAGETSIGRSNVGTLTPAWTTAAFPANPEGASADSALAPVVANGLMYDTLYYGGIVAFSANGTTNCSGSPTVCNPIWSANLATGDDVVDWTPEPTIAGGVAFVTGTNTLYAFDAAGENGCTAGNSPGDPRTCQPLWTGSFVGEGGSPSSPTVSGGVVYVDAFTFADGHNHLYAFDEAGNNGCSGTPKVCATLWSATGTPWTGAVTPTVANGRVYMSDNGIVQVFDAAGHQNCSGQPVVCQPLWTADTGKNQHLSVAAVSGDGIFVNGANDGNTDDFSGDLYAFDARGVQGCTGSPAVCHPLWTAPGGRVREPPAVANHTVYIADGTLRAYDARGTTNCSGTPKVCAPMWTSSNTYVDVAPAVADGLVYTSETVPHTCTSTGTGNCPTTSLLAFDANETQECSGSVCHALYAHTVSGYQFNTPVVANGVVYVAFEQDADVIAFCNLSGASPPCR